MLLSPAGVCKIADFGCSVLLDRDRETAAAPCHACGTYTHRAPELLRGAPAAAHADVYSAAITLWQLRTREPPYTGDRQTVLYAVVARDLRPCTEHAAFASPRGRSLRELLVRCWSADARRRPAAAELLRELELLRGL